MRSNIGKLALASLLVLLVACRATAQDTAQSVLAELAARAEVDVPTIAECDYLCRHRNEKWTVRSRSFTGLRPAVGGDPSGMAYAIRPDSADGLGFLFPSGAFMGIASRLDPLTLHRALLGTAIRLLPPADVDGVMCSVLAIDELPIQAHVGNVHHVPEIEKASVSLYIREGRIKRIVAEVTRKSFAGRPESPLILEANPRYRRPSLGTERPPSAPPIVQFQLEGNHAVVSDIAWSPDGKALACMGLSGGCTMISMPGGKALGTIPLVRRLREARFTTDGAAFVMPDQQSGTILYLDAVTGKEAKSVPIGAFNLFVVASDQSRALAWDRHDSRNLPRVVDCLTGRTLCELPTVKSSAIQMNANGSKIVVLSGDHITILESSTGRELHTFAYTFGLGDEFGFRRFTFMAFSPDSRLLAIGDISPSVGDGGLFGGDKPEPARIHVYDTETGKLVQTLSGLIGSITTLQFSPDGSLLAAGEADNRGEVAGHNAAVMLWETKAWKSLGPIAVQPQSAIDRLQFSPDSKSLATVSERSPSVEIWPVPRVP